MANPAPTINQINAFNATQGTTIDFNIIGGTELVRSNRIYIYDLSDNSLICTHLYVSTESIHELPPNTDGSIVYESGKSSADFVNGAQYYAQIQTFTDIGGTEGGSGLSVAKMFWCLVDPTLTITTIPSTISTTSYNVSATYDANTSVVSNIIQQYQFNLYSAVGSLLQSSGVVVGSGEQQGTSARYDISYNFSGLSVGSSYYVVVDVTTTQGMSISAQSSAFTVSIDTPTLGEATVVNNACDGYISVTSNLSSEYGGSASGEIATFETDSVNRVTKLEVELDPIQLGEGTPSPSNVRPIVGHSEVEAKIAGKNLCYKSTLNYVVGLDGNGVKYFNAGAGTVLYAKLVAGQTYCVSGATLNRFVCAWFGGDEPEVNEHTEDFIYADYHSNYLSFTATWSGVYAIYINNSNVDTSTAQVELSSTPSAFEPYQDPTKVSQDFNVTLTPTVIDETPYLLKKTGDVRGDRESLELVGGTVNWNQHFDKALLRNTTTTGNLTITNNNNGTLTLNGNISNSYAELSKSAVNIDFVANHKYLFLLPKPPTHCNNLCTLYGTAFGNASLLGSTIRNCLETKTERIYPRFGGDSTGLTVSNFQYYFDVIDLTAFFGSATIADYVYSLEQATAGAGVAWLKSYGFFTKPYYAYDTGTLKSVNPTAHVTRGVNAWDEEWEVGTIDATGTPTASSATIRSKNYIQIIPNTTYYCKGEKTFFLHFYDADKNWISSTSKYNETFTTPINAYYMKFRLSSGTSYNNDMCINISNPTINGKYFPYEEHTYDLGNVPLYGVFQLVDNKLKAYGDVRHAEGGTDRKFVLLDLGTLTWGTPNANGRVSATPQSVGKYYSSMPNVICTKYVAIGASGWYNSDVGNGITICGGGYGGNGNIGIVDSSFIGKTAAEVKTALSGTMLVYEKATTTTEQTPPFTQVQEVSKYGTLEYITTNDVPVGHNTVYLTRDIFGGYIDLVSGQLVVDWKCVPMPKTGWTANSISSANAFYQCTLSDAISVASNNDDQVRVISNMFSGATSHDIIGALSGFYSVAIITNKRLFVYVPSATFPNVNSFMTWLADKDAYICYELNEPLTYQLTPQQIQTLVGVNNVWSEQGDIELSYHIPITNLLVKRRDIDDVSGSWLTLYSQPIEQASDMDFTFIDFLNQYGKTYKYALVPLLTQTQSGVEVEVEGGYTVSDEVQSVFDGVFISDSTGSQKCKANVGYGNVNMNQSVGSITPIGSQYPIIVTNSNNRYHNGSISGMIVPDDYYYNGNLSRIDMVNKRNELEQFLTNKRAKIIKDWNSNIWLVMIMDNVDCSFDNNYGMGIVTFNANWLEIGNPTSQQDLQDTGLINVGGV